MPLARQSPELERGGEEWSEMGITNLEGRATQGREEEGEGRRKPKTINNHQAYRIRAHHKGYIGGS